MRKGCRDQASEPDSDMTQMLELSDWDFKIAMIHVKNSKGKSRQHARNDGKYKKRDGNSKKESGGNARDQYSSIN